MVRYRLPTKKEPLARLIDAHVRREEYALSVKQTRFRLAHAYLSGARRFDVVDFNKRYIAAYHLEEDGRMPMQMPYLLSELSKMQGELNELDFMPAVTREFRSLALMREAGTAQAILDALISPLEHEEQKSVITHYMTLYGCVGYQMEVEADYLGATAVGEIIHPSELLPFPAIRDDLSKLGGIVRQQMMPMSTLKERLLSRFNVRLTNERKDRMEIYEKQIGDDLDDDRYSLGRGNFSNRRTSFAGISGKDADMMQEEVVRVRQLWLKGSRGTVSRYIVTSGHETLLDIDYEKEGRRVFFPIHVARFMEDGTFYGAGMFDLLFSGFRELEKLVNFLVDNTKDLNNQRILVMPSGKIDLDQAFTDKGMGMRIAMLEEDPRFDGTRSFPPIVIDPPNAGDVPGRTAAFLGDVMERLSPLQDIVRNKGRVDSQVGLQFLMEVGRRSIGKSVQSLALMYSGAYRSVLANASRELLLNPRALPVKNMTLDLVGVVVDTETSTIHFSNNPLPRAEMLDITVRQLTPRSKTASKQEALALFDKTQDMDRLLLWSIESGIEIEWYYDDIKYSYQTVVTNILRLYGDGEAPGEIITTPHIARPEIQLKVLNGFMSGPSMGVATAEVVNAFQDYRKTLMFYMGSVLPENVPDPHDMALLQAAGQARLQVPNNQAPLQIQG